MEFGDEVSRQFNSLDTDEQAMILTFVEIGRVNESFDPLSAMRIYKNMKAILEAEDSEWES